MSTSALNVSSTAGAPITISGLASGLNTSSIISALMGVEREPVTHLTDQETRLSSEQTQLQSIQSSLQQLSFAASEFILPSLYESSQTVTSSEPSRVEATVTSGAGIGGYEVEVTQLANSAQRTFTFASPAVEEAVTIDGHEFELQAGETIQGLASAINASGSSDVYAAVLEGETLVLSNRATGATGGEFIKVTGAVLSEVAATAKEGVDAEYSIDGTAATSSSNTVTNAIAGVTLSLTGLTPKGPVTLDVQPPSVSATAVEAQLQSFIKLYNTTVGAIETQLTTKPAVRPTTGAEFATGPLFGDQELSGLLDNMRATMCEPKCPARMTSASAPAPRAPAALRRPRWKGSSRSIRRSSRKRSGATPRASSRCSRSGRATSRNWSATRLSPAARSKSAPVAMANRSRS